MSSLILLSLGLVGLTALSTTTASSCGKADIVFVIDDSGSISQPDFQKQLNFVEKVLGLFDVGQGKSHVGVLAFSYQTDIITNLDKDNSKSAIVSKLKAFQRRGGYTFTDYALEDITSEMFEKHGRDKIPRIAILLTDGASTRPSELPSAAAFAKGKNINIFAIGIGHYDQKELEIIASTPSNEHVLTVKDFSKLDSLTSKISSSTCKQITKEAIILSKGLIRTYDGNAGGATCHFPFTYKGKSYKDCITKGTFFSGFFTGPWCATTANYDSHKKWGKCMGKGGVSDVPTEKGNANGAHCWFPFIYKGKEYDHCITSFMHWTPWCATTMNYNADKKWGNCMMAPIRVPAYCDCNLRGCGK